MKILVTGALGQLGSDVTKELAERKIPHSGIGHAECDITDPNAVQRCFAAFRPDAVIHCAAYTAVDQAEDNPELCEEINAAGTRNIARASKEIGAKVVYLSTDYVFPGTGENAFETDDPTGPLNVYGRSKLDGETVVKESLEKYFIVRISWVFGRNGNNFVKTMLRLGKERSAVNVVCDR